LVTLVGCHLKPGIRWVGDMICGRSDTIPPARSVLCRLSAWISGPGSSRPESSGDLNMNRRHFLRLLCGAPAIRANLLSVAGTSPQSRYGAHHKSEAAYPSHTCVDQPTLPCPACLKWTGDGFASVNNSQCSSGITDKPAAGTMQYDTSGYAVMVRVRLVDRWTWTTWMRYDTYEQAAAHKREDHKIVPFGSAEWMALRQSPEPALPPIATPQQKNQPRCNGETLVEFVLRRLSGYDLDRPPAHSSSAMPDLAPAVPIVKLPPPRN
jgi:hypothetical protein